MLIYARFLKMNQFLFSQKKKEVVVTEVRRDQVVTVGINYWFQTLPEFIAFEGKTYRRLMHESIRDEQSLFNEKEQEVSTKMVYLEFKGKTSGEVMEVFKVLPPLLS